MYYPQFKSCIGPQYYPFREHGEPVALPALQDAREYLVGFAGTARIAADSPSAYLMAIAQLEAEDTPRARLCLMYLLGAFNEMFSTEYEQWRAARHNVSKEKGQ